MFKSQSETKDIMSQMASLKQRAKQAGATIKEELGFGGVHDTHKKKTKEEEKIDSLTGTVTSLEQEVAVLLRSLKQSSLQHIHEAFPKTGKENDPSMLEVSFHIDSSTDVQPMVFEIYYAQVPYTTWSFLREVQEGYWHGAIITSQTMGDTRIEIHPTQRVPDLEIDSVMDSFAAIRYLEEAVEFSEAFMIGIKQDPTSETGSILTLHLDAGNCGEHDNEVCFGKLVDGFGHLNSLQARGSHTISTVEVVA